MTKPKRIQLRRTKGWRMPPNTVKVDRATKWGNPFRVSSLTATAQWAVDAFRRCESSVDDYLLGFDRADCARELRGKNLACWCPLDQPCHADVLLEWANGEALKT
jgi:Domain of unknown function (DUF4326)